MICDTICGYCRKGVKSAHGIEEVYMYFNGSGIWGGETTCILRDGHRGFLHIVLFCSLYFFQSLILIPKNVDIDTYNNLPGELFV